MSRGVLWMVAATTVFTAMASLVKIAREDLGFDVMELMWWRSVLTLPLALWWARRHLRVHSRGWMANRVVFGFAAMYAWFTAARGLQVGELTVLLRLQPVFIGLLAPVIIGRRELGGRVVWTAVALGLAGSLLLLTPDLRGLTSPEHTTFALWAIAAACCSAVAHTSLRALGATDDPRTVVLWFQGSVAVISGVAMVLGQPRLPMGSEWLVLGAIGLLALVGQLMMTRAYQLDTAPRVSAATYVAPLLGFLADITVFATVPGWEAVAGAGLVIGAGMVLLRSRS